MKRLLCVLLMFVIIASVVHVSVPKVRADILIKFLDEDTADRWMSNDTADYFPTVRNGPGSTSGDGASGYYMLNITASAVSQKYTITRIGYGFNTSSLPDDVISIDSAILSLYVKNTNLFLADSTHQRAVITGFSPATNNNFVAADFNTFGPVNYSNNFWDLQNDYNKYVNFTFNANGIANISKTSYTNIMLRYVQDQVNSNSTLTWTSGQYLGGKVYDYTESAGKYPLITIVYTPAAGGDTTPPNSITNLANSTNCSSVNWTWTNPTISDFNHTYIMQNGTFYRNATNSTTFDLWSGLPANTAMTFSSKTVDITGNMNATFVNQTANTSATCAVLPIVQWTIDKQTVRVPGTVTTVDTSLNTPTSWQWYWGDGSANGTSNQEQHKYVKRGVYQAQLTATNAAGSNTSSKQVRVIGYDQLY